VKATIVVSDDYGCLSEAIYLVRGWPLQTSLLLPRRMFALNRYLPGCVVEPYDTAAQVLESVGRSGADAVVLVSGYLLFQYSAQSAQELRLLTEALAQRGIPLATTDPFLGLWTRSASPGDDLDAWSLAVLERLRLLAGFLADALHLYAAPLEHEVAYRWTAYSNPRAELSDAELMQLCDGEPPGRPGNAARTWLFYVSGRDAQFPAGEGGAGGLHAMLSRRVRECMAAGRIPVVVAPAVMIVALSREFGAGSGVRLVQYCGYEQYVRLLLCAEYVFGWNRVSSSVVLVRLLHRRPVFFLGQGHMERTVAGLAELAMRCFFPHCEFDDIDPGEVLDAQRLALAAASQDRRLYQPVRRRLLGHADAATVIGQWAHDARRHSGRNDS